VWLGGKGGVVSRGEKMSYRVIPGHRNWQIETAAWNLDIRLD